MKIAANREISARSASADASEGGFEYIPVSRCRVGVPSTERDKKMHWDHTFGPWSDETRGKLLVETFDH
jgi:hypothetical protein